LHAVGIAAACAELDVIANPTQEMAAKTAIAVKERRARPGLLDLMAGIYTEVGYSNAENRPLAR